jgi:hypothetical protein
MQCISGYGIPTPNIAALLAPDNAATSSRRAPRTAADGHHASIVDVRTCHVSLSACELACVGCNNAQRTAEGAGQQLHATQQQVSAGVRRDKNARVLCSRLVLSPRKNAARHHHNTTHATSVPSNVARRAHPQSSWHPRLMLLSGPCQQPPRRPHDRRGATNRHVQQGRCIQTSNAARPLACARSCPLQRR